MPRFSKKLSFKKNAIPESALLHWVVLPLALLGEPEAQKPFLIPPPFRQAPGRPLFHPPSPASTPPKPMPPLPGLPAPFTCTSSSAILPCYLLIMFKRSNQGAPVACSPLRRSPASLPWLSRPTPSGPVGFRALLSVTRGLVTSLPASFLFLEHAKLTLASQLLHGPFLCSWLRARGRLFLTL